MLYFTTYLVVFLGIYTVTSIGLSFLRKILPKMFIGIIDSTLGGVLGGLKSVFIIIILLIFFNLLVSIVPQLNEYSKESKTNKFFLENISKLKKYYPKEVKEKLDDINIEKKLKEKLKEYI
jgi:uncharacterized membrane protein required for colicin V production